MDKVTTRVWARVRDRAVGMMVDDRNYSGTWRLIAHAAEHRQGVRVGWLLCTIDTAAARELYAEIVEVL